MDTTSILLALVIVLVTVYVMWGYLSNRGLPPTPTIALPVVGHLLSLNPQDPRSQMQKWREKVGDVFSLRLGPTVFIVLNGYDAIKEAFVKRGDDFSDRPFFYFDWAVNYHDLGITLSSGPNWKHQRSVSLSILRDMGMGKNVLAETIQDEVSQYLARLSKLKEKHDIRLLTGVSVANVLCSMLVGQRFDYDDPTFKRVVELVHYNLSHLLGVGPTLLNMYPILHYLPGDIFNTDIIMKNRKEVGELFVHYFKDLKGHKEYSETNMDSFIANYVFEKSKKENSGQATYLDDKNLTKVIEDLLGAGIETTSNTISWFLLYMLHYPKVQEKIFKEIESEIGTGRSPTMHDKTKLKYLNAAIMETQRIGNTVPMGLTHMCARDTTFRGFKIPKGANVIGNMTSVFFDKTVWGEDVDTFRPERFIDDIGDLKHFEEFIPFSIGRRACLGEAMAKMELFLYLSSMCQRFQFLSPDPDAPPKITEVVNITRTPGPFEIKIVDRLS